MSVNGPGAADTFVNFKTNKVAACLETVVNACNLNGRTPSGKPYPTAMSAYRDSQGNGVNWGKTGIPKGALCWLGPRPGTGVIPAAGDVFFSIGGGKFAATDYPSNGVIGIFDSVDVRIKQTGRPWYGWTDNITGTDIILEGDDMGTIDNTEQNYQTLAGFMNRFFKWDGRDSGTTPPPGSDASKYGLTLWDHFGKTDSAIASINVTANVDIKALVTEMVSQGIKVVVVENPNGQQV